MGEIVNFKIENTMYIIVHKFWGFKWKPKYAMTTQKQIFTYMQLFMNIGRAISTFIDSKKNTLLFYVGI